MEQFSRRSAIAALLAATGATTVGCSKKSDVGADPITEPPATPPSVATPSPSSPSPSKSATPEQSPPARDTRARWPLTGLLMTNPAAGRHPAVAVKVPDNKFEHPQKGINAADIVFVQLEGYVDDRGYSGTRLMPVFHTSLPAAAAPVRSLRPVDIPLLAPMNAIVGNTGATDWVIRYGKHFAAHLETDLSYMNTRGTGAYSIDKSRVRSFGGQTYYDRAVVCHPAVLAKQTTKFAAGPQRPYFPWADAVNKASTLTGAPVREVTVAWKSPGTYDMGYTFDTRSNKWLRSEPWGPHVSDGSRVVCDNVLVIHAAQRTVKLFQGSGPADPMHDIIDSRGDFVYFNGGRMVKGTWTKAAVQAPFVFTVGKKPLFMAPGRTFVELARPGAGVVKAK